jgi:CRISPR/Cas system-associated endonuclease/helicase Cas3
MNEQVLGCASLPQRAILDTLVQQLIALGCTVIILSATLTRERRKKLLNAEPCKNEYVM